MILRKNYHTNNIISANKTSGIKNGGAKSLYLPNINTGIKAYTSTQLTVSYREIEATNERLTKLVEIRTKKLCQVIRNNARFMTIIAHDLRSPFNSILGFLEIIQEDLDNNRPEGIKRNLDIVHESADTTLHLLDSLLHWAISQSNAIYFNPVLINLDELLKKVIENSQLQASIKKVSINSSISPDFFVNADQQMVMTIFRNLIGNAIKYSNPGGKINIRISEDAHFVKITVEDNGVGMSDETLKKLFKAKKIHSEKGTLSEQGTGIGLSVCREFIRIHGGEFQIESKPGAGSKFIFSLPRYFYPDPDSIPAMQQRRNS